MRLVAVGLILKKKVKYSQSAEKAGGKQCGSLYDCGADEDLKTSVLLVLALLELPPR